MPEEIEIRIEGGDSLPVLVYLPGVHGDWTLIGDLSRCLRGKVRFVSCTYPRTLEWSLDEYAAAVEAALAAHRIRAGWLLAESFSSQVAWAILGRARFAAQGVILAGGFVKHPIRWMVGPAGWLCRLWVLRLIFPFYVGCAKLIRRNDRDKKEMLEKIGAFIARRTEPDLQVIRHRLRLIAFNDPRAIARQTAVPVFGLTGLLDPIVPWPFVRHWLRQQCPALRDFKIIARSDHNVLNVAAGPSAKKILQWMQNGM